MGKTKSEKRELAGMWHRANGIVSVLLSAWFVVGLSTMEHNATGVTNKTKTKTSVRYFEFINCV